MAAKSAKIDLELAQDKLPSELEACSISQSLSVKAFCVLNTNIEERHLEGVLSDISVVESEHRFEKPPEEILDGLLGSEGSAKIADLDHPNLEEADRRDGESIRCFDSLMNDYLAPVMPYFPRLDIEVQTRTIGTLLEAGTPLEDPPPLTEKTAAKWVSTFARHKIMCIWCLGPDDGSLELQPFDDEANTHTIPMQPGTFVILRADALAHKYRSRGRSYCMVCFYLSDMLPNKRRVDSGEEDLTPCCRNLVQWAYGRIRSYKETEPEQLVGVDLPRRWELVMNHMCFVNQHISIRTAAIRQPSTYRAPEFASGFLTGVDYVMEIPLMRFDISNHYDPEPECWRYGKTFVKHGSFIEGIELFDNTVFRISRAEAIGMDPGHRLTLETGYEALIRDGYKVSSLINSKVGVYLANPPPSEWGMAEKQVFGSGVCGSGGSVGCGRVSFTHGLKGPCISFDVEGASSLVAVQFASNNLSRAGRWEPIPAALCSSWMFTLGPHSLLHGSASGSLSILGRTFCFDAAGHGFVRGECAISIVLRALTDVVEGELVICNAEGNLGVIAACMVNQSGKRASMRAPDGLAWQEVIVDAVGMAEISPLDVDACACDSNAQVMEDALESSATSKAFRPEGMPGFDECSPIVLTASKTCFGNQIEATGLTQLLKVCLGSGCGIMHPTVHLRLINPFMDLDLCERPAVISTETLEYNLASSYTGVTGRSAAGTNTHAIVWGKLAEEHKNTMPDAKPTRDKILFWPEGGGELEDDKVPHREYTIVGSFNQWSPEPMEREGRGVYGYDMILGENKWERFQIRLDGDTRRVLHPGGTDGQKSDSVHGPEAVLQSECWIIDGRTEYHAVPQADLLMPPEEQGSLLEPVAAHNEDAGEPGECYRIRIRVAGKWRTVDWEKIERAEGEDPAEVGRGSYQVVGAWADGAFIDMKPDPGRPGLHSAEVALVSDGGSLFQVNRNRDWAQAFYPAAERADSARAADTEILGPDEQYGNAWVIEGRKGDFFRIDFERHIETGKDTKKVSWEFIRNEADNPGLAPIIALAEMTQYYVSASWGNFAAQQRMRWRQETSHYSIFLELGPGLKEEFRILQHGHPSRCIYPSEMDANPHTPHELKGPDKFSAGFMWSIGSHSDDNAEHFARYEIRLYVAPDGSPQKVDWVPCYSMELLEDAKGRGFLAYGV